MPLPDEAVVHTTCVGTYHGIWRTRAAAALTLAGVPAPTDHSHTGLEMIEYKKHRVTADDIVRTVGARPADGTAEHWAFREGVEDGFAGQPMKPKGNPYIAACYKDGHAVGVAFADFLGRLKARPTRQMVEGLADSLRAEGRQDGRLGKWNVPKTDEMIAAELAAYQEGYDESAR